jgi:Trk K+ transport system NAD-binding subunit
MKNHVILCGLGRVGWRILAYLQAAGTTVVTIDNRCLVHDPRLAGAALIVGDCQQQSVLEKAGVTEAQGIIIALSDELAGTATALLVRRLNPRARIVLRMFNQNLIARLGSTVSNIVALSTSALTAPLLALIARTGDALGTFRLDDGKRQQIAELTLHELSPLCGRTISDLLVHLPVIVLAHATGEHKRLLHEIDVDAVLQAGDRLVLCGEAKQMAPLLVRRDEASLPELLWAGLSRRLGRVVLRTVGEIDLAVKICASVLLVVIVTSTVIFYCGVEDDTVVDAFYRTISLMATGADMRGGELPHGGWQKFYVGFLRMVGAALTAAFTAILTNYLVRAQLGGALEVRRIPDSGHIIVVGLGNIGFRVVEELVREDEKVVVLERMQDNPLIPTARRLGVAVIVGDATVSQVLKQANVRTARAVIAATSKDLVNLEIGLLAREENAAQRVVLSLADHQLAQALREAADVRLAFSIPALTAPAFVAALFGDRVRGVFLIEKRLLAVVDLTVPADDSFLAGRAVRELAVDYALVPLRLQGADKLPRAQPLNGLLAVGDRLTVIIGLTDLQRLLQREQPARTWAVEATECPLTAVAWMVQLARSNRRLALERSDEEIAKMPCRIGEKLTRGQAEDLLFRLRRERVTGRLVTGSS